MDIVRNMSRALVAALLALSQAGCIFGVVEIYGVFSGLTAYYSANADLDISPCDSLGFGVVRCHLGGPGIATDATVGLGDSPPGSLWDPLIVQVPAGVSSVTGTFSGPASGTLSVTEVSGPLQADATRQIAPETGMKFLIVDFPGGAPPGGPGNYHFTFGFSAPIPTSPPLALKVLFAAKITVAGKTYYPPLFPCTTNMSDVPVLQLPANMIFTPINLTPYSAQKGCSNVVYSFTPPAASEVTVVEYHHSGFDHYFMTPKTDEIAILDSKVPPFELWSRTGHSFKAYGFATAPAGAISICRFFNDSFAPKSSHFYALKGFGCEDTLAAFPDWRLEDDKLFNAMLPDAMGGCPAGTVPLHRVYNHGMGNAPNHRFVTTLAEKQLMVAKGYDDEGVRMCVPV